MAVEGGWKKVVGLTTFCSDIDSLLGNITLGFMTVCGIWRFAFSPTLIRYVNAGAVGVAELGLRCVWSRRRVVGFAYPTGHVGIQLRFRDVPRVGYREYREQELPPTSHPPCSIWVFISCSTWIYHLPSICSAGRVPAFMRRRMVETGRVCDGSHSL